VERTLCKINETAFFKIICLKMNRLLCSGLVFMVFVLSGVQDCSGETSGFHRETSLDELKGIDSLVYYLPN